MSNRSSNNRRRPHDGNVGPRTVHDEDDFRQEDVEEDEGENMHNDFSVGKNPTRQAVSRRVAAQRGHEAFAEMGRKGGKANAGVHAGIDYDNPEEDDEGGVPAKNPNRVRGGKQAARTRAEHGDTVSMSEAGRRGGESQRGRGHLTQSNWDEEDDDWNERDNKDPNRVRGGQKAAAKRSREDFVEMGRKGGRSSGGNTRSRSSNGRQSGGNMRQSGGSGSRGTPPRDSQGHFMSTKGGNQRGVGRRGSHQYQRKGDDNEDDNENEETDDYNEDNEEEDEDDNENYNGKNPNRVRGGKRAASHRSHEDLVRAGKKGAESRWGRSYDNDNDNEDEDENDEDNEGEDEDGQEDYGGKNPNRVRAGKIAASRRSHEDFAEMGRKGGRATQQRRRINANDDDDDEDNGRSNKRQRGNHPNSPVKLFAY